MVSLDGLAYFSEQGLWQGGKSGYRPNLQKIVKEIWEVFVFLFLGGARFCLRQETEVQ